MFRGNTLTFWGLFPLRKGHLNDQLCDSGIKKVIFISLACLFGSVTVLLL